MIYDKATMISTNYISIIKKKVPLLFITLNMIIVKDAFETCNAKSATYFWSYYPSLIALCIAWEFWHSYTGYVTLHNNNIIINNGRKWGFVILDTFLKLICFVTTTYFMFNGKPFNCLFAYDKIVADIIFYLLIIVVILATQIEKYYWKEQNVNSNFGIDINNGVF